jgi:D-aminopeptidase
MYTAFEHILIIADIEGSSGCWSYQGSSFLTPEWAQACLEMTYDVNAVVKALFNAGVERITVKDFHRTGYNLMAEFIDSRAQLISGYRNGSVPGLGDPIDTDAVMFLGMHAASGTGGFLAHTLTSRIAGLEVNGKPTAEVALFASALAPHGIRPIFFSGCPMACSQASDAIENIHTYSIDKSNGAENFDTRTWRKGLAAAAVEALENSEAKPYKVSGPFDAVVRMRDGEAAAEKISQRWGFKREGAAILLNAGELQMLYIQLIRLCYLNPFILKILPLALFLSNLKGRIGLAWVRRRIGHETQR